MKQVDFRSGNIFKNIMQTAMPMLAAQILNLLYNIVDRIYIARIPETGTTALGAVGLCFPVVVLVLAFTNMYGSGGAPLYSIKCGEGDREEAGMLMNTSFFLLVVTAVVLTVVFELLGRPVLRLFGTSDKEMFFALPYLRIYLTGTVFSMTATGMNPFINAQGFSSVGMTTVMIGSAANIILDPIFIFRFQMGVRGAAVATVISQALSAAFALNFLFGKKADQNLRLLTRDELRESGPRVRQIVGLGFSSFIMQFTNSLVQVCANAVLSVTGGDLYISIMTIVSSVRQILETPLLAIADGTTPVISFNYGFRKPDRVKRSVRILFWMGILYAVVVWLLILRFPEFFVSIFSSDSTILDDAVPALHTYFFAFFFMVFQYTGQTTFKALNKRKQAVFFSLFRKAIIVIPLTFLLPHLFGFGTMGVFLAEPVSNVIGGLACYITMRRTIWPEMNRMEKEIRESG
ncbi:MAG: MATE family efflux transporter [Bilifractor sp.]|jgi:putative MATE family efflux protein